MRERVSASQRVRIVCPDCGHVQSEPAMVVSTMCRNCSSGIQIKDGAAVTRPRAMIRVGVPKQVSEIPAPPPPPPPKPQPPVRPPQQSTTRDKSFFDIFRKATVKRSVKCFQCEREHMAVTDAQSSQCPYCGTYLSLRDYIIDEIWNRAIRTRGNILIRRGAAIENTTVSCHNLVARGELCSPADCSGDLTIHSECRIPGPVRCAKLRVERGARVEFLGLVTADLITIAGEATGSFVSKGPVTVEKRAQLRGKIVTPSLVVKPGGIHVGTISTPPESHDSAAPPPPTSDLP